MSFHSPHLLWLLVPLVLLFSWELARHVTRAVTSWPKIARAWAGATAVSLGAQHSTAEDRPRLWLWFGLALCLIALARPQWGVIEEQVFDQSREVLIAVDLSRSMLAQDVKPSRLDRSKLLIQSLLDGLKGERVGLVLFAGTAFLQSPLSSDYEVLREFLPALDPAYLPEGGSNYQAMLEASMAAFGTSTADRYLIILSDGESTVDDWKSLTPALKAKGVRVIGLGVGTAQGSFIPDEAGGLVKDERGAVVMSRLNNATLQELAQSTGGTYTDASAWVDLPGLLSSTIEAGKKGEFSEKNTARLVERFQWFLAPGLLFLLCSFWAEFPVRPRERALPLGKTKGPSTTIKAQKPAAASLAALCLLSSVLSPPSSVRAAEDASPGDTLAKPLSTLVTRLAAQPTLSAKDCAELATTTVTYGQRAKSAQQAPQESVIRDALQAVDLGEQTDAQAADWPKLRQELTDLLKREEQKKDEPKQDEKNEEQQKQDQQKDQEQKQDQSSQDQQKSDQQKQDEQKQQQDQKNEQQKQNQDAFGDMKDQQEQKAEEQKASPPPPPKPGTQKVGGQKEEKSAEEADPELAMPLQKLEQVRNQDSPAKLQQLMQGQQPTKPKPPGKNW
ncbi:von Willebrand factor type A domain protein [Lacunisphaera limnophila]|uniref:von Willebrand factor type A domain protein n=1 Tax=Lacunisphaera limnophila TaxID=1838286 RepID=A0A1D8AVA7_9BACT|nr:VWA domain-containing protein [Lacunisphaera limnophila]AOS44830.1 von Willebrand factor type A domain protein [Lacunisphaera limnophila]